MELLEILKVIGESIFDISMITTIAGIILFVVTMISKNRTVKSISKTIIIISIFLWFIELIITMFLLFSK